MKNKIFFIIFMFVWLILVVLNFMAPKKEFSEQENRYLASVPKFNFEDLVNGKYAGSLDTYINDHFIFRDFFVKLHSFMQIATGKTENNGVYIGKDGYLFEKFEYGQNQKENLEKSAQIINNFAQKINIPTYFLLIPNSIYINQDKLPDNVETYNQKEIIDEVYYICDKSTNVLVTDILLQNKNLDLYFKTDHHMTSLGAYVAYKEFCKSANIKPADLDEFKSEIVSTEFLGTFDSKAQVLNQKMDKIVAYKNSINQNVEAEYDGKKYNSIFNEEYLSKKDKYSYFLNGNSAKAVVKTKVNNGKKLLVIKDSYAHIMAQFLCQNYEEVHFVDPRYYRSPLSEYVVENGITDCLFLYNLENLTEDIGLRNLK